MGDDATHPPPDAHGKTEVDAAVALILVTGATLEAVDPSVALVIDRDEPVAHEPFASDARLDDVMVSFATDRGGVGPHVDSYDVFLLQASGRRRWRIATRPVGDAGR